METGHGVRPVPRYPIFVPSKNRYQGRRALTVKCLTTNRVPFYLVCELHEREEYEHLLGDGPGQVLTLPFSNLGLGSIPARNWIKDYATDTLGAARHWQIDDNVIEFRRFYRGKRIPCAAGVALRVCEDFTDRYENVAVSGLNYQMFAVKATKPFVTNCHVYSCTLVNNAAPYRWRGRYNEDTDLCLQALAGGWCTVLLNVFLANKLRTMAMPGGNTDLLYTDDGRLKMARELERRWPGVVTVERRFQRPQHVVNWKKFDTPLRLRDGLNLSEMTAEDEYGLSIVETKPIRSAALRAALDR